MTFSLDKSNEQMKNSMDKSYQMITNWTTKVIELPLFINSQQKLPNWIDKLLDVPKAIQKKTSRKNMWISKSPRKLRTSVAMAKH